MTIVNNTKEWYRLYDLMEFKGNWKRFFCNHKKNKSVFMTSDTMLEGQGFRECENCKKVWMIY